MKKTIAVLGLGKYGISLAKSMYEMGADVLVVDNDPDKLKDMDGYCTASVCADLTNEDEVEMLGLKNMDIVAVAMAGNLSASIMSVAVAKELKVPLIVAKSSSDRMTSILKKIGADKVIVPEEYGGEQSARILASDTFLDYFKVDENLCMVEMLPLPKWVGKNMVELNLRKNYKINVIAYMNHETGHWKILDPTEPLDADNELLIVLERDYLHRINK
ncbi:potassium channel family protein [Pseudobutyrivibrio xylanivorans]|uniref:Trk system potassium uptake protein TrkA n=1 Tax=Pseudobutyrivibrio xylanivorans DSM 14809 TaxID=1123012 RepID=A0A1M6AJ33_PSEXY|nr:TrkA family potassium uptake protein [Pseudobutyrivibrio xylanivorans]SHI36476.1 trk system potassium uptake protein TrkA [Pseudobutyrivibrio xylanivorans DSM 14809]